MDMHVEELVKTMEHLLKEDDIETARYLKNDFVNVWIAHKPDSPERKAMASVLEKAMIKWH
jgi:hypothetical protein